MPFDTSVLDAALARRRANFEQQRQQLLAKALALLDELGPGFGVKQAYLFGSLVTPGRFAPESDIELIETFKPKCGGG